jgi:hypothetical protein
MAIASGQIHKGETLMTVVSHSGLATASFLEVALSQVACMDYHASAWAWTEALVEHLGPTQMKSEASQAAALESEYKEPHYTEHWDPSPNVAVAPESRAGSSPWECLGLYSLCSDHCSPAINMPSFKCKDHLFKFKSMKGVERTVSSLFNSVRKLGKSRRRIPVIANMRGKIVLTLTGSSPFHFRKSKTRDQQQTLSHPTPFII